jgi:mannose-6-phosphate isomerase
MSQSDHTSASRRTPYPLQLTPMVLSKVWGGRRLADLGLTLPDTGNFGEAWMLADLAATSSTGAGGQAMRSLVANGPRAGEAFGDVLADWSGEPRRPFPLLVKFLDAREHLSVQVHPSPAYAAAHPDAHLKTECWYVMDAEPGAELLLGVKEGVTVPDIVAAVAEGDIRRVLHSEPAVVGQCYTLPSGLIHALGAGVLVAEVQTPSDTTFRLYDWTKEYGRPERGLHLGEALAACDLTSRPLVAGTPPRHGGAVVADTSYFRVREIGVAPTVEVALRTDTWPVEPAVFMMLEGSGALMSSTMESRLAASAAAAIALPPDCANSAFLRCSVAGGALLVDLPPFS